MSASGGKNGGKRGHERGKRHLPRGRQPSPAALAEVRALLGENPPLERQHLIEHLHLVQDAKGYISADMLAALAQEMKLSMAEVFQTLRFYEHFDFTADGEAPPAPLTIRVCVSLPCALEGGRELAEELRGLAGSHVRVIEASCMGGCDAAPFAMIGRNRVGRASAQRLMELAAEGRGSARLPKFAGFGDAMERGGYRAFARVRKGEITLEGIIAGLDAANLRGMGGAGFPAAVKWRAVAGEEGVKYVVINADEGEPGTFKDRRILETSPHDMLEGALIAAEALKAQGIYIYLRDEYPHIHTILSSEILLLEELNITPRKYIHLRRGAGAYVCGEESALIESLEGKRGWPRQRPPYVSQKGLFGRPTLVHNVETISRVPLILREGGAAFAARGGGRGLRHYSVSGRVKNPGVYEAPAGSTARDLIEMAGGMADGHSLRAFLPGGASGGILPASLAGAPLDFGALDEYGAFVGSHALIVLSDRDDLKRAASNLMAFFAAESCGQCTPCREGCKQALGLMRAKAWDAALLEDLAHVMREGSICGLGQAAPNVFMSLLRHFPEEVS